MAFNEDYKWVEVQTWFSEESQPPLDVNNSYQPAGAVEVTPPQIPPQYTENPNSNPQTASQSFEQSIQNNGNWTVVFKNRVGDGAPIVLLNTADVLTATPYYNKETSRHEKQHFIVTMASGVSLQLFFPNGIGDGTETPPSTLRSILPPNTVI
jgi:hypothetical protein